MSSSTCVAVGLVVQQRLELGAAEQGVEHLAVDLDQQRVAAGVGDQRVEPAVERAELVERHPQPELLCRAADRFPFGGVGAAAGELEDRQLDHAARLEQLRDVELARVGFLSLGRGEGDFRQSSATYRRLPRRSIMPSRHQALDRFAHRRAGDTELLAQRALGRDRRPGCQLAGSDPFGEASADLFGDRLCA